MFTRTTRHIVRSIAIALIVPALVVGCSPTKSSPPLPSATSLPPTAILPTPTLTNVPSPTQTTIATETPLLAVEVIRSENVPQLERIASLKLPSSFITEVIFSPDGREMITSDRSGEVIFWDVATWEKILSLYPPSKPATGSGEVIPFYGSASLSPDGKVLVTASESGEVSGRDRDGNVLFVFPYGERVLDTNFSPDGRYLAIGGENISDVLILEVATGNKVADLVSDHTYITSLVFFSGGKKLLASYERPENVMKVWDTTTWKEISTFSHVTERIDYHDTVFSPDEKYLAIASTQNQIKILDVETWQVVKQLSGHSRGSYQLAFSPDGSLLASAADDLTLRIWDMENSRSLRTIPALFEVGAVTFSPDGALLAIAVWGEGVQVWAVKK